MHGMIYSVNVMASIWAIEIFLCFLHYSWLEGYVFETSIAESKA